MIARIAALALCAVALVACNRSSDEEKPPVNVPQPDPIVVPTNQLSVPPTNLPTVTTNKR